MQSLQDHVWLLNREKSVFRAPIFVYRCILVTLTITVEIWCQVVNNSCQSLYLVSKLRLSQIKLDFLSIYYNNSSFYPFPCICIGYISPHINMFLIFLSLQPQVHKQHSSVLHLSQIDCCLPEKQFKLKQWQKQKESTPNHLRATPTTLSPLSIKHTNALLWAPKTQFVGLTNMLFGTTFQWTPSHCLRLTWLAVRQRKVIATFGIKNIAHNVHKALPTLLKHSRLVLREESLYAHYDMPQITAILDHWYCLLQWVEEPKLYKMFKVTISKVIVATLCWNHLPSIEG